MSRTKLKDGLYAQFARIGKATSNPTRFEILELLAQAPRSVEDIAREVRQSVANTSQHLQALRLARLVDARKEGLYVFYRLSDPDVIELCHSIRGLAEKRFDEMKRLVKTYFGERDQMEPVSREALLERLRDSTVIVLDVRPEVEYEAGHIAGAVSVPVEQLEARLAELPGDVEIIAYCRGPYCVYAYEAVEMLRAEGRQARRLVDGFPEWRAADLPVETGQQESTS